MLVLFGGGLSLAAAVEANSVSGYIGQLARGFAVLPQLGLLVAIIAMTVFLSEVTSNTAQVATMTPVLAAMAPALGLDPKTLVVVCALAAPRNSGPPRRDNPGREPGPPGITSARSSLAEVQFLQQ